MTLAREVLPSSTGRHGIAEDVRWFSREMVSPSGGVRVSAGNWSPVSSSDMASSRQMRMGVGVGGAAYLTAMTSTVRMSGFFANGSAATWPSAVGISPLRCAWRASSVSNESKMP
jgi:hypothetical protein